MRALIFQHAPSEGPGLVLPWLQEKNYAVEFCRFAEGEEPPAHHDYDFVLILGGGMNIYQHRDHPWLVREKEWLMGAVERGIPMVGICLGGQLLADVLGGRVTQNEFYEVGWWPVDFTVEARAKFPGLPERANFMHWHGDTFSLPSEAVGLAANPGCANQGFIWRDRVLALQFHPEVDEGLAASFAEDESDSWPTGPWVQPPGKLVEEAGGYLRESAACLRVFLDGLIQKPPVG